MQVAPGHVQPNRIAEYVPARVGGGDIFAADSDRHHQFNLMVQVAGQAGVGNARRFSGVDDDRGVAGLEKEEGGLTPREAHLLGMLLIVAANAVNPVYRECFSPAQNRNADLWHCRKYKTHVNLCSL